jgi:phosphotransferase system, enzyme I, PtsP
VALCGEMGGRTLEAMALIGIGYRTLSMSPSAIGPVKAMVRSMDMSAVEPQLAAMLADANAATPLRERLRAFAEEQGVQL